METRADTERIQSPVAEQERIRTCRPAVVMQGREPDRTWETCPEPNIVRGED